MSGVYVNSALYPVGAVSPDVGISLRGQMAGGWLCATRWPVLTPGLMLASWWQSSVEGCPDPRDLGAVVEVQS